MKLMNKLTKYQPVWAPEDGSGTPPSDPPAPEGNDPAPAAGEPAGDPAPAAPAEADYSFLPEQFRSDDGPDIDGFQAHYDELVSEHAQRQEALAGVPEDASGYEFAIPDELDFGELDLPDDFAVNLKTDDPTMAPLFEGLGGFMHKHGLPKDAAGDLMGMIAKYEATKYSQLHSAAKAEMQSLGSSAQSRIANVKRSLESKLPAELASALSQHTTTAKAVQALEKLLAPRSLNAPAAQATKPDLDGLTGSARLKAINEMNAGN